jgi:hypothetical protein
MKEVCELCKVVDQKLLMMTVNKNFEYTLCPGCVDGLLTGLASLAGSVKKDLIGEE